ncbi:MAG: DUF1552 domain-containing protein [bacterium]
MKREITRRRFLRGTMGGAAITVGLPLLDIFLSNNGDALASGAPLPRRFGTWFWGCGMNAPRFDPRAIGTEWEISPELEPFAHLREDFSVISGTSVLLAGETNQVHFTGAMGALTGEAPPLAGESERTTFDVQIGDKIGNKTRFRSLDMAATGIAKHSNSQRNQSLRYPSETSPLALYQRVFGSGFTDPNAADFSPDPGVILRRSALSVLHEDRTKLEVTLGATDRARLDEYFTALRQLELQLDLQLRKPPPMEACSFPDSPEAATPGLEVENVIENHRLMAQILAMALACDQTRVFNMVFSNRASSLHAPGSTDTHHTLTHEEPKDPELGYQVKATEFVLHSMRAYATLIETLKAIPEGDGTLLDNCLVMGFSETSDANTHSVTGLPFLIAGRAGGRVKSGIHARGVGETASRVGLTLQQAMGLRVARFGVKQNETDKPFTEIMT